MPRLIDADALKKRVKEFRDDAPRSSIRRYVCNAILSMLSDENQAPTIEAEPVRHGRWENKQGGFWQIGTCSICGSKWPTDGANYCPNCGAKMDGDSHAGD